MTRVHTIPVPHGWSIEQSWDAIRRGEKLTTQKQWWANIETDDEDNFIRIIDKLERSYLKPKLIIGDRQSGRTTELIKAAAAAEARGETCYIVCHSQEEAYRIAKLAKEMELSIGFPLTYSEFIHRSYVGNNIDKFYIDNLRMLLREICNVDIDTVVW